jgi:hypothetical protein
MDHHLSKTKAKILSDELKKKTIGPLELAEKLRE